ncbi:MAG: TonB-dependent receptor [Kiritimatiellae bacterium]|nr:TonB-dependent receptor [Kiritimatiellia bacterium]
MKQDGSRSQPPCLTTRRPAPACLRRVAFCAAALSLFGPVFAAGPEAGRPPGNSAAEPPEVITVTASLSPTHLSRNTAAVTLLPRTWIDAQHANSALELLALAPGLHVDQTGGRGGTSSVYLRGLDPNHTLVLIDGVKVNDSLNTRGGAFDFATLSTEQIEHIEIVRGPLSAVHGSDAIAGVVNIITRRGGPDPVRELEVWAGAHDLFSASLHAGGACGPLAYALSGGYTQNSGAIDGDAFQGGSWNANFEIPLSASMQLHAALRQNITHREAFPDDSGGPEYAVWRDVEERDSDELAAAVTFTHAVSPGWEYSGRVSAFNHEEEIDSPGVAPGRRDPFGMPASTADNTFRPLELSLRSLFAVSERVRLALGAQALFEEGTSKGSMATAFGTLPVDFEMDRTLWAPFAEVQLSPVPQLVLQAGIRADVPDESDTELSPRLGAAYTVERSGTTLRASWGEAFKLPSFFALSHPVVGNPDLVAEKSQSVDAGVSQPLIENRAAVSLTFFQSLVTDGVDFEEGPPPRLVNRAEIAAHGLELGFSAQPVSGLRCQASVTWAQTNIRGTDEELRNRPDLRGSLSMRWTPADPLELALKTVYVGDVLDSSVPTGDVELDPYLRTDLAATWRAGEHWRLFVAVDNLFDAKYEEYVGFEAPGIAPRVGLRAVF